MSTKIKFCGLTRASDIDVALALGVDYLGLILVPESPRRLDWAHARTLRRQIGSRAQVVLLTRHAEACSLHEWTEAIQPDVLQFHGDEDQAFCAGFGLPWWKAVPMGALPDEPSLQAHLGAHDRAQRWLFDSHGKQTQGGRGLAFDWSRLLPIEVPYVLAGGLKPETVADAVRQLRPWAVDVASGIEASPGIKDADRMQQFVAAVRSADAAKSA